MRDSWVISENKQKNTDFSGSKKSNHFSLITVQYYDSECDALAFSNYSCHVWSMRHVFRSYASKKILLRKISDLDKGKENSMKLCVQQSVKKRISIFANLVSVPLPTSPMAAPPQMILKWIPENRSYIVFQDVSWILCFWVIGNHKEERGEGLAPLEESDAMLSEKRGKGFEWTGLRRRRPRRTI